MSQEANDHEHFLNRELSWLEFNRRVLEEAQDPTQPLLERVKFLGIFGSNLDEFFEIRVAGIKQQIESDTADVGPDGMVPSELFRAIREKVRPMVDETYRLWREDLAPALEREKIFLHLAEDLEGEMAEWATQYFRREIFPVLTPLGVGASHPFPEVGNKSLNLILSARRADSGEKLFGIVQVPRIVSGLVTLPAPRESEWHLVYLSSLIRHHIGELFPGLEIDGVHAFRLTRNSDLYIDEEEAENLLRTIEQELRRQYRGRAVRLEVESRCPDELLKILLARFRLGESDVYRVEGGPIPLSELMGLHGNERFARLRDRPFSPSHDPALPPEADVWQVLRRGDVLLHHPYESFDSVVGILERAAEDPKVLAIKMTLYRTSGDSPFVASLARAASEGKQVTALVELKARFDEANNIQWARKLEEAGVHVLYGVVGLKTHCKMMLIVRRDQDRIRQYVHLGTGNYHPKTARIYTDLSLLTSRREITSEVATLFNTLTGLAAYPKGGCLMVAPFDLAQRLIEKIGREKENALAGRPARVVAKLNSVVDDRIICALYEASQAGVRVDLVVRGICCLRPGVPGLSENIRVISIVGRFLEHSRIFVFENGGEHEVYLGSADWMPRNLYRRVEVVFPVDDPALKSEIIDEILPAFLNDRVKARELRADGSYFRLAPEPGTKPSQAQLHFREIARSRTEGNQSEAQIRSDGWLKPAEPPA